MRNSRRAAAQLYRRENITGALVSLGRIIYSPDLSSGGHLAGPKYDHTGQCTGSFS